MRFLQKVKLLVAAGAAGGVVASYLTVSAHEAVDSEDKSKDSLNYICQLTARTKWDANWDKYALTMPIIFNVLITVVLIRREPHSLLKPSKRNATDDEKSETLKPTATRNLLLIRHGQYNLSGQTDAERYLTALGNVMIIHSYYLILKCLL